jgi:hypothetical protein
MSVTFARGEFGFSSLFHWLKFRQIFNAKKCRNFIRVPTLRHLPKLSLKTTWEGEFDGTNWLIWCYELALRIFRKTKKNLTKGQN